MFGLIFFLNYMVSKRPISSLLCDISFIEYFLRGDISNFSFKFSETSLELEKPPVPEKGFLRMFPLRPEDRKSWRSAWGNWLHACDSFQLTSSRPHWCTRGELIRNQLQLQWVTGRRGPFPRGLAVSTFTFDGT